MICVFYLSSGTINPFWYPAGAAIAYTIFSPFFRNALSVLVALFNGLGNKYSFLVAKKAPVSVRMYYELQGQYNELEAQVAGNINENKLRNERLSEALLNATSSQNQKDDLHNENRKQTELLRQKNVEIQNLNSKLETELDERLSLQQKLLSTDHYMMLQGQWFIGYEGSGRSTRVNIADRIIEMHESGTDNGPWQGMTDFFIYDPANERIAMRWVESKSAENVHNIFLKKNQSDGLDTYNGFLNERRIVLHKLPF